MSKLVTTYSAASQTKALRLKKGKQRTVAIYGAPRK